MSDSRQTPAWSNIPDVREHIPEKNVRPTPPPPPAPTKNDSAEKK